MKRWVLVIMASFLGASIFVPSMLVRAQEPTTSDDLEAEQGDTENADDDALDPTTPLLGDEQADAEEAAPEKRSDTDPHEEEGVPYFFLGAHYEHRFIPGFMLGVFLDVYEATSVPSGGLQFTYRIDNFDMVVALNYANYSVNGYFRGNNQPDGETEYVDINLHALTASVAFLWSTMFTDIIGLQYGLSVGAGGMFGNVVRTEAYRASDGYQKCVSVGNPLTDYCDAGGDYGKNEPTWFDGGSKPAMWFRFAPQIGVRVKPIRQVVITAHTGFDIFSGFLLGTSVSYGF